MGLKIGDIMNTNKLLLLCVMISHTAFGTTMFWQEESEKKVGVTSEVIEKKKEKTNDVQMFINQHERVVVMFTLTYCPYCRYLQPLFDQLEKKISGSVHFKTIVIDNKKDFYKNAFNFKTAPMVIYYKNGKEQKRHGSDNKAMTLGKMRGYIKSFFG